MTAKELTKARALYIGYLLGTMVCYFFVFWFGTDLIESNHRSFGDWLLFAGYVFGCFFSIDLVLSTAFRRKSRPWHFQFSRPPEDRWPRR